MCLVSRLLWILLVVGCNEVTTPPETVQLELWVGTGVDELSLEGAKICQTDLEPPNCETTNADGRAMLVLPANQKLSYTVEKKGYGTNLYPVVTGSGPAPLFTSVDSDEALKDAFNALDSRYPLGDTGAITVIINPRQAGATFELLNATGKPWYLDEEGLVSGTLVATTTGGMGGFFEVPPGEFTVEVTGVNGVCAPTMSGGTARSWPGDADNRFQAPVREGFFTRVIIACPLPP